MPHHRARFTARGREVVVRRVVDDRQTFAQGGRLGERVDVERVDVGRSLAAGDTGRSRVAGLLAGPPEPAEALTRAGAGVRGGADLRAARADRLEPAPAR